MGRSFQREWKPECQRMAANLSSAEEIGEAKLGTGAGETWGLGTLSRAQWRSASQTERSEARQGETSVRRERIKP